MSCWVTDRFGVRLTAGEAAGVLPVPELVRLALRRNPRRAHLLVSTVLGKHLPVDPAKVVGAGRALGTLVAAGLDAHEPPAGLAAAVRNGDFSALPDPTGRDVLVLGYCETATALGHVVAQQLGAPYLHSTRLRTPELPVAATFEEGHSHATTHLLQPADPGWLRPDVPLVLVDDELSTGRTIAATIAAIQRVSPRGRYLVATLVDLRGPADRAQLAALADRLGVRIEVVSLGSAAVELPPDLIAEVSTLVAADTVSPPSPDRPVDEVEIDWPAGVPTGGRQGLADHAGFAAACATAAEQLAATLPAGARRVLVIGTEEFMAAPLLIAQELARDPSLELRFQSTTRSPVLPLDDPGYPVRRRFTFAAPDGTTRYLYNADWGDGGEADLVLVLGESVTDAPAFPAARALRAAGLPVIAVSVCPPGTRPLAAPAFGSYPAEDVRWLLTDLSGHNLEGDVAEREARIQAGTAHYAESLPREYHPAAEYQRLFEEVLAESADRLALAVGLVTELVLAERGRNIVLTSLARAGTPVGVLMRRWALFRHDLDLPHFAVSIVRGRGIDTAAMRWLAGRYDPASVVFVDGWTGKGAITRELTAALAELNEAGGVRFDDRLAVLADPGECVSTFGTRDDFLIASACLNSTVSGLVSRTVLNRELIGHHQFHGAKFYAEFAGQDVSRRLVDTVSDRFAAVAERVAGELPALLTADRTPTFTGWAAIERIRQEYGISSVNFVKPGVGETTRVLLRRVPWRILLRSADHPDHRHLRLLAADRNVPTEIRPDLPYSCVGLIRQLSDNDRGEG